MKLNLGCGDKPIPGYVNIDTRLLPGVDVAASFFDLPYTKGAIQEIYMCHSLEHTPLMKVQPLLSYLSDLLRDDGQLYISVPDFSILSSLYLAQKVPLSSIVRAIHGGQEYEGNLHYISFDMKLLSDLLKNAGFQEIKEYEPTAYLPEGFEDTSTYCIGSRRISLNICARK
jgi:predicted SAM-dependent methyltransferase